MWIEAFTGAYMCDTEQKRSLMFDIVRVVLTHVIYQCSAFPVGSASFIVECHRFDKEGTSIFRTEQNDGGLRDVDRRRCTHRVRCLFHTYVEREIEFKIIRKSDRLVRLRKSVLVDRTVAPCEGNRAPQTDPMVYARR